MQCFLGGWPDRTKIEKKLEQYSFHIDLQLSDRKHGRIEMQ